MGNLLKGLDSQPGIKANIKKKVLKYWLKKLVRQDNETAKQSITIKELIREIADQEYNENSNKVLLVEFNWYHGECIPGFYKYLSDLNYDVDLLVNEGLLKEKAFDVIKCNHIYNCDIELMGLLLQYVLIEQYQFVIFNSNAFTWKGGWHTVLQEFPFLFLPVYRGSRDVSRKTGIRDTGVEYYKQEPCGKTPRGVRRKNGIQQDRRHLCGADG